MNNRLSASSVESLGLLWLVRLRWIALLFFSLLIAYTLLVLEIILPLWILTFCLFLLGSSNGLLYCKAAKWSAQTKIIFAFILFLDVGLLTTMMYYSGGAHNPFTIFYLLHITVAVLLLSRGWAWGMVLVCGLCFAFLFTSDSTLVRVDGHTCCTDMSFHLWGMLLSTVAAGGGIIFFAGELKRDLVHRQKTIQQADKMREQHARFASMATISAGVAHELSTPLSTIAVISGDFEQVACNLCKNRECVSDAKMIREEVEKCHQILQRLRQDNQFLGQGEEEPSILLTDLSVLIMEYLPDACRSRVKLNRKIAQIKVQICRSLFLQSAGILVKNSIDASSASSPVFLEIQASGNEWKFVVKDEGCGISPDNMERIGEPFFTTKSDDSGMGLGLFLVRTYMESIQGRFELDSIYGKGTVVTLHFPISGKDLLGLPS